MVALSFSTTHSSIRMALRSSVVTISSAPCNCSRINFVKMISKFPSVSYPKVCAIEPRHTFSATHLQNWEDPDGSDSGTEDEEETNAPETSNNTTQIEEYLIKEVEQLLTSEERAIMEQNEAPDLDKISTEKWNPLHTLALAGQIKFMDSLLGNGFDINAVDKDGQTALHKAVLGKKEAVISHLLRKGASPHVQDLDGATPLHYAVQVSAMQTVKLLIKSKVDVNVADKEGWTPLHVAMQNRNRDIAKVLLVNGADKTRRNEDGKTPVHLALCYGKDFKAYDLAKLLKLVPANNYV